MQLQIEQRPNFHLVRFRSPTQLNVQTRGRFFEQVAEACPPDRPLLLDCSQLDFIDSTGISALIRLHKRLKAEGHGLVLTRLNPAIEEIMHVSRLHRLFEIVDDFQAAVAVLEQKPAERAPRTAFAVEFDLQRHEDVVILRITSPEVLVEANSMQFLDQFRQRAGKARRVVVDLSHLKNIDSLGVAALIHLQSQAKKDGRTIVFVCGNPTLERLLRLYHIDSVLLWEKSIEAALQRLGVKRNPAASRPRDGTEDDAYIDLHFLKTGKYSHA